MIEFKDILDDMSLIDIIYILSIRNPHWDYILCLESKLYRIYQAKYLKKNERRTLLNRFTSAIQHGDSNDLSKILISSERNQLSPFVVKTYASLMNIAIQNKDIQSFKQMLQFYSGHGIGNCLDNRELRFSQIVFIAVKNVLFNNEIAEPVRSQFTSCQFKENISHNDNRIIQFIKHFFVNGEYQKKTEFWSIFNIMLEIEYKNYPIGISFSLFNRNSKNIILYFVLVLSTIGFRVSEKIIFDLCNSNLKVVNGWMKAINWFIDDINNNQNNSCPVEVHKFKENFCTAFNIDLSDPQSDYSQRTVARLEFIKSIAKQALHGNKTEPKETNND